MNSINLNDDHQYDQIRLFLKDLGDKFSFKRSPNIWQHLGQFKNETFSIKTAVAYFWAILINLGYLLFQHLVTLSMKG